MNKFNSTYLAKLLKVTFSTNNVQDVDDSMSSKLQFHFNQHLSQFITPMKAEISFAKGEITNLQSQLSQVEEVNNQVKEENQTIKEEVEVIKEDIGRIK